MAMNNHVSEVRRSSPPPERGRRVGVGGALPMLLVESKPAARDSLQRRAGDLLRGFFGGDAKDTTVSKP